MSKTFDFNTGTFSELEKKKEKKKKKKEMNASMFRAV